LSTYLSVVAIYRDEAPYLREWIEFHRIVGVERFFLYNNFSLDNHREVLAPYVEEDVVVVHDWPVFPGQLPAYDDALRRHGPESRWIAFIDLDEFLFSPDLVPLPELLREYEEHSGLLANWIVFGSSGYRTQPPGLVTENYLWRMKTVEGPQQSKSIIDPSKASHCGGAHFFFYKEGTAVNERHEPVPHGRTFYPSAERIRVNHYYTKSIAEGKQKLLKRAATTGDLRQAAYNRVEVIAEKMNEERDETILAYLPELRSRLGMMVPEAQPESSN
jgi:hypothetical protein